MEHHHGTTWTPERVEDLTKLWAEGWSASHIANRIGGVTRNAVIGKVCRLNLPPRAVKHRAQPSDRAKPYRQYARTSAPKQRVKLLPPIPSAPLPDPTAFDLDRLNSGDAVIGVLNLDERPGRKADCRWPVGTNGHTHVFCGLTKVDGSSYCEVHVQRSRHSVSAARPQQIENQARRPVLENA